ncbi:hypothetical protein [Achromobacter marplatensis]|uniref:hypothetical protein n=1 Tax=Achromobacter marplatensis TaxID=470868 RepID=UPI000277FF25|nr:hypothetical protein [Achromobacter marplatensis]EJO27476.1 hypothetical protein QWC_31646 [Achromobacter marplatensis]
MTTKHTEGPWRWAFNAEHRSVQLVGGRPQYDLTVMDFTRWGMGGAGIRLRELSEKGMNLLHKLQERPDWIAPFPGREHHKHWCADVVHPDMRLIAAAPELLAALEGLLAVSVDTTSEELLAMMAAREAIAKARGAQ